MQLLPENYQNNRDSYLFDFEFLLNWMDSCFCTLLFDTNRFHRKNSVFTIREFILLPIDEFFCHLEDSKISCFQRCVLTEKTKVREIHLILTLLIIDFLKTMLSFDEDWLKILARIGQIIVKGRVLADSFRLLNQHV